MADFFYFADLPEEQVRALSALCEEQGISRAEAVRRALADMLDRQKKISREAAFGAWRHKKTNSRTFIRNLRKEWES